MQRSDTGKMAHYVRSGSFRGAGIPGRIMSTCVFGVAYYGPSSPILNLVLLGGFDTCYLGEGCVKKCSKL